MNKGDSLCLNLTRIEASSPPGHSSFEPDQLRHTLTIKFDVTEIYQSVFVLFMWSFIQLLGKNEAMNGFHKMKEVGSLQ